MSHIKDGSMSCLGYEYDPPMRQIVEDAVVVSRPSVSCMPCLNVNPLCRLQSRLGHISRLVGLAAFACHLSRTPDHFYATRSLK
jgi:hypothetical protein